MKLHMAGDRLHSVSYAELYREYSALMLLRALTNQM